MTQRYMNLLLHIYQPPWQYHEVLEQIINECYGWLVRWLSMHDMKVTMNMNLSLVEKLYNQRGTDDSAQGRRVLDDIAAGVDRGVIELTSSAAYHALLPKLPAEEIQRQMRVNDEGYQRYLGLLPTRAVFPPEMAVSPEVAAHLKRQGYVSMVTDAPVYDAYFQDGIPSDTIPTVWGMPMFLRSAMWSNRFAQEYPNNGNLDTGRFVADFSRGLSSWFDGANGYAVLAFDGETIGHHHSYTPESLDTLWDALQRHDIEPVHMGELLGLFPGRTELMHQAADFSGSWSTTREDIWFGKPYPLWDDPENPVHQALWELAYFSIDSVKISGNETARRKLDKALNSCPFWWADFGRFNPRLVYEGVAGFYDTLIWASCSRPYHGLLTRAGNLANAVIKQVNETSSARGLPQMPGFSA